MLKVYSWILKKDIFSFGILAEKTLSLMEVIIMLFVAGLIGFIIGVIGFMIVSCIIARKLNMTVHVNDTFNNPNKNVKESSKENRVG